MISFSHSDINVILRILIIVLFRDVLLSTDMDSTVPLSLLFIFTSSIAVVIWSVASRIDNTFMLSHISSMCDLWNIWNSVAQSVVHGIYSLISNSQYCTNTSWEVCLSLLSFMCQSHNQYQSQSGFSTSNIIHCHFMRYISITLSVDLSSLIKNLHWLI